MDATLIDLAPRLAVALGVGLLVGVERGWRERAEPAGSRTAGVRTYTLSGFLGGVSAALAGALGLPALAAAAFVAFALVFAVFKLREALGDDTYSVTSVVAAMLVFAIGALAVAGDVLLAAGAGVATAVILASREVLHGFLERLTWPELRSALVLLAMTAIVLPMLPDRAIDPFGGFNPRDVWMFTILTAAVSFAGYVAIKVQRFEGALVVAAVLGALVSSTAVTLDLARRAVSAPDWRLLAGAAVLAGLVSLLRVLAFAAILAPQVAVAVAWPAAAAAGVLAVAGGSLVWHRTGETRGIGLPGNPFDLCTVMLFAAIFAAVSMVAAVLAQAVGPAGLMVTCAVFAIADVDAAALAALRLAGTRVSDATAADAILLALAVNGTMRAVYAALVGPRRFTAALGLSTVAALAAGLAALAVTR